MMDAKGRIKNTITTVLSIAALLVSISVAIYTQFKLHYEEKRYKRQELRSLIIGMLEIREVHEIDMLYLTDSEEINIARNFAGLKLGVYLDAAEHIVRQMPKQITPEEYSVLSQESLGVGKYIQAEYFLTWAAYVSKTKIERLNSFNQLGLFYFEDTSRKNINEGREKFKQAVESIENPVNDNERRIIGGIYELWGDCELRNGFDAEAQRNFNLAKKYYSDIGSDYYPEESQKILENLEIKINRIKHSPKDKNKKQN